MSEYENQLRAVEAKKCPTCDGIGEYDDAEPGDMYFNTYKCEFCDGTGLKPCKPKNS